MSNTQRSKEPAPIRGDHGIGLCSACVQKYIAGMRTQAPEFAITYVAVAPGVTLPACYDDAKALITGGSPLIVPNGRPRG